MAMAAFSRTGRLSREERIGLAIAIALHVALVAWLALDRLGKEVQAPPERMTVSLAEDVAPEATSPEPLAEAAPDLAPTLGEAAPKPVPTVEPRVVPMPKVAAVRTPPKIAPAATPQPRQRPDKAAGASRIGSDFLKGVGGDSRGASQNAPAAKAGPQVAASLAQAISRQLKPHWSAPQGVDADQLVTVLSFDLNEDGSLAGRPRVVGQSGVTDANRAQKARHAEQAIRSVQLAAPFDLPAKYYSLWKHVASFRFDRRLSQ